MLVQYVLTFKMFLEGGAGQGILFLLFLFQIFCLKILLKHFQYSQVTQSKSAQWHDQEKVLLEAKGCAVKILTFIPMNKFNN